MADYITDTDALIEYLAGSPQLGPEARAAFDAAVTGEADIHIPALVLVELLVLSLRHPGALNLNRIVASLQTSPGFHFTPLSPEVILRTQALTDLQFLHDRVLVAQALEEGLIIITRNPAIADSAFVPTTW